MSVLHYPPDTNSISGVLKLTPAASNILFLTSL